MCMEPSGTKSQSKGGVHSQCSPGILIGLSDGNNVAEAKLSDQQDHYANLELRCGQGKSAGQLRKQVS